MEPNDDHDHPSSWWPNLVVFIAARPPNVQPRMRRRRPTTLIMRIIATIPILDKRDPWTNGATTRRRIVIIMDRLVVWWFRRAVAAAACRFVVLVGECWSVDASCNGGAEEGVVVDRRRRCFNHIMLVGTCVSLDLDLCSRGYPSRFQGNRGDASLSRVLVRLLLAGGCSLFHLRGIQIYRSVLISTKHTQKSASDPWATDPCFFARRARNPCRRARRNPNA